MENLEAIIELLYKRTSIQKVINEEIKSNDFSQNEFMAMVTAYVFHYSESESWNLLNYFLDSFQESAKKKGRKIERKLNVFEPLFFYAQEFLIIRNNEILCHYSRLMEWRKMTTALSEDLIVSAFLAGELTHSEMRVRGYAWKTVIGHNNAQLNAVMRRGISENHSHLNGAAPIFQISWLSLMNNVNISKLGEYLRAYDRDRRYTNVAYSSAYKEKSFYERYMQAALIRLLLYCKISGKRFKIGEYETSVLKLCNYIEMPTFICRKYEKEMCLDSNVAENIVNKLHEDYKEDCKKNNCIDSRRSGRGDGTEAERWRQYAYRDLVIFLIEECVYIQDWKELWKWNPVLEELLESAVGKCMLNGYLVVELIQDNIDISLSQIFLKLLYLVEKVPMEAIQKLFIDKRIYGSLWEKKTLVNVKGFLRDPEEIIRQQEYLQSVVDVLRQGDYERIQGTKNLDYILGHFKYKESMKDADNFIFSGERWLMYTMLRKVYLNDREYQEYFNFFYAYLLIKESVRSELIQSNKNVGFMNFNKYQRRKGELLTDAIYKNEFTRLAVSNSLVSRNIRKIELRIAPEENSEKMCTTIRRLDHLLLPDQSWKSNMFYTVHFLKSPEKLPDGPYMYCRHYHKRKDIEKRAYALTGLREKYPYVGERILGIDAAANEIGCRPEVFAPMFRYLKKHRHRYYTADGIKKLPQLAVTYHVGEDFLDLADGLRAIEEAVLFLNLESGDRLGHALALGIDVKEWYQMKRHRIAIPIQDYLDNLVWIFHKIVQYDIRGFENLKEWIRGEYTLWFGRLYKENMWQGEIDAILMKAAEKRVSEKRTSKNLNKNLNEKLDEKFQERLKGKNRQRKNVRYFAGIYENADFGIFNYVNAWKLRGDDPKSYELGYFEEDYFIERNEEFRVNFHYLKDFKERKIPEAALLYYMYHFNKKIREDGEKTVEVAIPASYVDVVAAIQKCMQKEIAERGIAIETNPSSNFLIGTFREYEKHPILRFYNKGLIHEPEKIKECPQLSVSINTDDQGVFSTSLENEYALMACALESVCDAVGDPVYDKSDVYEWLDRIRVMGNEQSFGWDYEPNDEDEVYGYGKKKNSMKERKRGGREEDGKD